MPLSVLLVEDANVSCCEGTDPIIAHKFLPPLERGKVGPFLEYIRLQSVTGVLLVERPLEYIPAISGLWRLLAR